MHEHGHIVVDTTGWTSENSGEVLAIFVVELSVKPQNELHIMWM